MLEKSSLLDGRTVLVTGAGRGLGRAYAASLASHGARVAVNSRSAESTHAVVDEITNAGGIAYACPGDLVEEGVATDVVAAAFARFGGLDALIHNAGGDEGQPAPFTALGRAERSLAVQKNLDTAWEVTAAAWPHLAVSGTGRVVLTSSALAFYGVPGFAHYAAAKGAVVGLARTMAVEGKDAGVAVNVLKPLARTAERGVVDRWPGSPFSTDHVAAVVAWMASEACTLTGQIISAGGDRVASMAITESDGYRAKETNLSAAELTVAAASLADGTTHESREMAEMLAYLDTLYGGNANRS